MKYLILSLIAVFTSTISSFSAVYYVNATAHWGPIKSSPEFTSFASNTVESIRNTGKSVYQLKNTLLPKYVTGFPLTNTLWFAIEIFSEEPFYPTNLVSQITSSPNNIFGKTTPFNDPSFGYSLTSVGAVWPIDGPIEVVRSGTWGSRAVNHFVFLGDASKTLNANSQVAVDANTSWLLGFSNFTITASWTMNGVSGSASKILQTRPWSSLNGKLEIVNNPISSTQTLKLPEFVGWGEVWSTPDLNTPFTYYGSYLSGMSVTVAPGTSSHFWKLSLD